MKTDIDTLIADVLRLDGEATPGPWNADHSWWPGEDEDEYAAVGPVHKLRKYDFLDLDTPEKRAGLDVAMTGIRADESLIARYRTAAPILAAEVRRLRADLEEAARTIAAEQGRQEGAPGPGWEYSGQTWHRGRRRCTTCRGGWEWWIRSDYGTVVAEGRATTARTAMQAADRASP